MRAAEGFGPGEFARVALHFEVGVAFAAAEAEEFRVVADEGYALGGVAGAGAEVAGFDSAYALVLLVLCHLRKTLYLILPVLVFCGAEEFVSRANFSAACGGRKKFGGPCFRHLRRNAMHFRVTRCFSSLHLPLPYYLSLPSVNHGHRAGSRCGRSSGSFLRTPFIDLSAFHGY